MFLCLLEEVGKKNSATYDVNMSQQKMVRQEFNVPQVLPLHQTDRSYLTPSANNIMQRTSPRQLLHTTPLWIF